jgi:hypothetical protein
MPANGATRIAGSAANADSAPSHTALPVSRNTWTATPIADIKLPIPDRV